MDKKSKENQINILKMKVPVWIITVLFFILLGTVYLEGRHSTLQERQSLSELGKQKRDSLTTGLVTIKGLQNSVTTQRSVIFSQRQAIKNGLIDRGKLRKLHIRDIKTNTHLSSQITVLKKGLQNNNKIDTVVIRDTIRPMMELPADFHYKDKYVDLGVGVDSTWKFKLMVPMELDVTVGKRVVVTTDNPYIRIDKLNSVIIPDKKEKRKMYGIGMASGLFIAAILTLL